ncbi:MAG: hypothetical protein AAGH40_12855 [Verrucomicrobiota bacterium]
MNESQINENGDSFSLEQKEYIQGFFSGVGLRSANPSIAKAVTFDLITAPLSLPDSQFPSTLPKLEVKN